VASNASTRGRTGGRPGSRIILVIGGAASGKSRTALAVAGTRGPRVFLATGQPLDDEMTERIRRHRNSREADWKTVEEPVELASWFSQNQREYRTVLLDCLTLWLSNLCGRGLADSDIFKLTDELLQAMRKTRARIVIVTNELGLGLVPMDAESRRFRDLAGQVNQQCAREADEVHLVISGLCTRMK